MSKVTQSYCCGCAYQVQDDKRACLQVAALRSFTMAASEMAPDMDAKLFISAPLLAAVDQQPAAHACQANGSPACVVPDQGRAHAELYRLVTAENVHRLAALLQQLECASAECGNQPRGGGADAWMAFFCKEVDCASSGRGTLTQQALVSIWNQLQEALQQLPLAQLLTALQWMLQAGPHPFASTAAAETDGDEPPSALELTPEARAAVLHDVITILGAAMRPEGSSAPANGLQHPQRSREEAAELLGLLRTEAACTRAADEVRQRCQLSDEQAEMVEAALALAAEGPDSLEAALPDCLQVWLPRWPSTLPNEFSHTLLSRLHDHILVSRQYST